MENNQILNTPYTALRWHYATDLRGNMNYADIRRKRRIFDPTLGSCHYGTSGEAHTADFDGLFSFNYYNLWNSTKYIHGNATKSVFEAIKSHVNLLPANRANQDANFWEHVADTPLGETFEVEAYCNANFPDFHITYTAHDKDYLSRPDFVTRCHRKEGSTLMLILDITGANKQYKTEKKRYAEEYWCRAVNAKSGDVEWRLLEVVEAVRNLKAGY